LPLWTVSDDDQPASGDSAHVLPHTEEKVDPLVRYQAAQADEEWLLRLSPLEGWHVDAEFGQKPNLMSRHS
jgi:hypothetical protein